MPSQIDFAIAVGLFLTFISILIVYLTNYILSYTNLSTTSELRTIAYNTYLALFSDKGIPRNWTEGGDMPLKVGLVTNMYRVPVIVSENSSTNRGNRNNVSLNLSLTVDQICEKRAWNNTLRVLNGTNDEMPIRLYNQTFCSQQFLKSADIVFNSSFLSGESRTFFVYFSDDKNISAANYTMDFPSPVNFTFTIYPEEKLTVVSVEKLRALRRLNYSDVLNTLNKEYYFNVKISDK